MDKLQKALEKARVERGKVVPEQANNLAVELSIEDMVSEIETISSVTDDKPIIYSETRTINVSPRELSENRIIAGIPGHPQADVFRVLRTKTLQRMRDQGVNSLAITSPTKGVGKSIVSANLAIAMALEVNQTILLVDLDLRKPSIESLFGFKAELGLANHLLDNVPISEILVHPGIERLVLLPAGMGMEHSSELLTTPRMKHLVDDIVKRYQSRIIIFDIPPLLGMDDALQFLPQVEASLLVVEENVSTPDEINQSLQLLESANPLGVIYNKARQHGSHIPYY